MEKFQIMGKKLEHHGHILDFYTYELKVPNGNTAYWDVLEHKGASAIIPVDEDGKIILVRQYRGAIYYTEKLIPSKQHLDENEFVQIERYSLEELNAMIFGGRITDGKTIAGIMAYQMLKHKNQE